jgi:S-adenosylmethionine hydrolase
MVLVWVSDISVYDPQRFVFLLACKKKFPDLPLYDVSGSVPPHNILVAAYFIQQILKEVPEKSVILCDVKNTSILLQQRKNSVYPDNSRHLIFNLRERFLITPDNGIIGLLDPDYNEPAYIVFYDDPVKNNFFVKDIYLDAVEMILSGEWKEKLPREETFYRSRFFKPVQKGKIIECSLMATDSYGNLIFNFRKEDFDRVVGKNPFEINISRGQKLQMNCINSSYEDVRSGELFAIFNAWGYLEIGIYGDSLYQKLFSGHFLKEDNYIITIHLK